MPPAGQHGDGHGDACLFAGAALATTLISMHAAGRVDPYWATAGEHLSTALCAGVMVAASSRRSVLRSLPGRSQLPALALLATMGVGGDLAYATAARYGELSITSAVASLYPVSTIALARLLQDQRVTRSQLVGVAVALFGAALLASTTN